MQVDNVNEQYDKLMTISQYIEMIKYSAQRDIVKYQYQSEEYLQIDRIIEDLAGVKRHIDMALDNLRSTKLRIQCLSTAPTSKLSR